MRRKKGGVQHTACSAHAAQEILRNNLPEQHRDLRGLLLIHRRDDRRESTVHVDAVVSVANG
jgi:hypothetical protein